jgi:hypothetical protein
MILKRIIIFYDTISVFFWKEWKKKEKRENPPESPSLVLDANLTYGK